MRKTLTSTRDVLTVVILALAFRALFGDAIGAFMDGMYIGFTDGI